MKKHNNLRNIIRVARIVPYTSIITYIHSCVSQLPVVEGQWIHQRHVRLRYLQCVLLSKLRFAFFYRGYFYLIGD